MSRDRQAGLVILDADMIPVDLAQLDESYRRFVEALFGGNEAEFDAALQAYVDTVEFLHLPPDHHFATTVIGRKDPNAYEEFYHTEQGSVAVWRYLVEESRERLTTMFDSSIGRALMHVLVENSSIMRQIDAVEKALKEGTVDGLANGEKEAILESIHFFRQSRESNFAHQPQYQRAARISAMDLALSQLIPTVVGAVLGYAAVEAGIGAPMLSALAILENPVVGNILGGPLGISRVLYMLARQSRLMVQNPENRSAYIMNALLSYFPFELGLCATVAWQNLDELERILSIRQSMVRVEHQNNFFYKLLETVFTHVEERIRELKNEVTDPERVHASPDPPAEKLHSDQ